MLQNDVKYRTTIEKCNFFNEKLLVFQKNYIICNNTNLAYTMFIRKTLTFTKTIDYLHIKIL